MSEPATRERVSHIRGLAGSAVLLPWPTKSKGSSKKWGYLQLSDMNEDSYLAKLAKAGNIGVALGRVSNGLVTVDFDQDGYSDAFLAANPLLKKTLRTRAVRGCNVWMRCAGGYPPSQKLRDTSGIQIGEWRADGNQTIITGLHPDGMPYQFVVEKPALTVDYEAITWPPSIVPPDATESKRVRGVGENKVVGVRVCNVGRNLAEAFRGHDLISQIAPAGYHQNNASLFKLGRLVKSCESAIGRLANETELDFAFDHWCLVSRRFWRSGHTRDDYYAEFLNAYSYARTGLDEDPIKVAVSRAKARPLPEVRGFTDQRIRLLAAICRELDALMAPYPFFLPTRKIGEILGVHCTRIASWLRAFGFLQIIHLAPGEIRRRGGNRSPRYCYGPLKRETEMLPVIARLASSQPPALTDRRSNSPEGTTILEATRQGPA